MVEAEGFKWSRSPMDRWEIQHIQSTDTTLTRAKILPRCWKSKLLAFVLWQFVQGARPIESLTLSNVYKSTCKLDWREGIIAYKHLSLSFIHRNIVLNRYAVWRSRSIRQWDPFQKSRNWGQLTLFEMNRPQTYTGSRLFLMLDG